MDWIKFDFILAHLWLLGVFLTEEPFMRILFFFNAGLFLLMGIISMFMENRIEKMKFDLQRVKEKFNIDAVLMIKEKLENIEKKLNKKTK